MPNFKFSKLRVLLSALVIVSVGFTQPAFAGNCPGSCPPKRFPNYYSERCPDSYPTPCKFYCPEEYRKHWASNFGDDVRRDFSTYFRKDNLLLFGNFLLVAGIFANTGIDKSISRAWQEDIRGKGSNNFFKVPKYFGDVGYWYFPVYLAAMGVGYWRECSLFGNVVYHWGYRSLRTYILGGVQQVILTYALSGGRPNLGQDSKWQPFRYKTGVSGHAHYGAIPFLTAAMMTDPPILRYGLYALSTLPGLSRINSNKHYFSQVLLGWGIAFLSARAVYNSDLERTPKYLISLAPKKDGFMLAASMRF